MLCDMPRRRLPQPTQAFINNLKLNKFNWQRNDNVDSLLAFTRGTMLDIKEWCTKCVEGTGMMIGCVVVPGHMNNVCSNHWKSSK